MSEAAANLPADADAATRLRFSTCATCGVAFAMPALLYLARAESAAPFYCPNGHSNVIKKLDEEPLRVQLGGALDELSHARSEANHLRAELSALHAKLPAELLAVDRKELMRRCEILAARAEQVQYGQLVCPVCGKQKKEQRSLRDHLRRTHARDVSEMSAGKFT
jgi:hypothetical protein